MGERRKHTIRATLKIIQYCNVESATMKELADHIGVHPGNINKTVADLVDMGVLKIVGKQESHRMLRGKECNSRSAKLYEYNRDYKW